MAETMATRQAYGKTLIELGEKYPQLVVMDADLSKSTMTAEFGKTYPDRFFNMGIAEQNLYGAAADWRFRARSCVPAHLRCSQRAELSRSSEIPSAIPELT